jgi:hypothetical protein
MAYGLWLMAYGSLGRAADPMHACTPIHMTHVTCAGPHDTLTHVLTHPCMHAMC